MSLGGVVHLGGSHTFPSKRVWVGIINNADDTLANMTHAVFSTRAPVSGWNTNVCLRSCQKTSLCSTTIVAFCIGAGTTWDNTWAHNATEAEFLLLLLTCVVQCLLLLLAIARCRSLPITLSDSIRGIETRTCIVIAAMLICCRGAWIAISRGVGLFLNKFWLVQIDVLAVRGTLLLLQIARLAQNGGCARDRDAFFGSHC